MRLTFQGTVVELGIDYNIAGHVHNGMLIDCTGNRLVFVEMPPEQLRKMPLYASIDITIETQQLHQVLPEQIENDDARDARRYRWLRNRILVRKAGAPACDVTVHLNRDYVHAGSQYITAPGFEAEMNVLDATIDKAMKGTR